MDHYQKSLKGAAANREKALERYYLNPVICLECGKAITVGPNESPSEVRRKKKFCDRSCSAKYNNRNKTRSKAHGACERCGITVPYAKRSDRVGIKQGYRKVRFCETCRPTVQQESLKETRKRKGYLLHEQVSEMTKGELKELTGHHYPFKVKVTTHARKVFNDTYGYKTCLICGFEHIEVCHIKDVAEFENYVLIKEINSPSNLIGLCPNHHWALDNHKLNVDEAEVVEAHGCNP